MSHVEAHRSHRIGWLRAAVLGANDGIVSTASLIIGIAAAQAAQAEVLLAGMAGLVAGAMSMAAGEYVSVSSQADTEKADLEMERVALAENVEAETQELKHIYMGRGLTEELADEVARQLMAHDALGAHARDEIGIPEGGQANPIQAALSSGTSFTVGASMPVLVVWFFPPTNIILLVSLFSLLFLALLGAVSARAGGASPLRGMVRVLFWGALAMALTALVGSLFGVMA